MSGQLLQISLHAYGSSNHRERTCSWDGINIYGAKSGQPEWPSPLMYGAKRGSKHQQWLWRSVLWDKFWIGLPLTPQQKRFCRKTELKKKRSINMDIQLQDWSFLSWNETGLVRFEFGRTASPVLVERATIKGGNIEFSRAPFLGSLRKKKKQEEKANLRKLLKSWHSKFNKS